MRALFVALALAAALVHESALGHGPQIQITRDSNKITTRQLLREEPYSASSDPKRVYVIPLLESSGVWYSRPNDEVNTTTGQPRYRSGPGIAYGYGSAFGIGNHFELNLIDRLWQWNGAAFSDPGAEEIEAYRTNSVGGVVASAATSDALGSGNTATMPFGNISSINPSSHSGASFRLLGDGTTPGGGSSGIYLLSMTLSSTEASVLDSDPFYFLLHKNASRTEVQLAVSGLMSEHGIGSQFVQFVPEPSGLALMTLAALAFCAKRRRVPRG